MLNRNDQIKSKADLVNYFKNSNKAINDCKIGIEQEMFVFDKINLKRVLYNGNPGIKDLLQGLMEFGWIGEYEKGNLIGLKRNGNTVSLEPGGQIEFSGVPCLTVHEVVNGMKQFYLEVTKIGKSLDMIFFTIGTDPFSKLSDIEWIPKGRYNIMKEYMFKKGKLGHNMMLNTASIQASFDYCNEKDMVKKFRVSMALQPIVTALFANSPFIEVELSGYESFRSHIWTDTDNDRCGILPFVFKEGFGYESYVDYLLNMPMYFVKRDDDTYINAAGKVFKDFFKSRVPELQGEKANFGDWLDHITTVFPEVRLKNTLEMRGADSVPTPLCFSLPALWAGILYDDQALNKAYELIYNWPAHDVQLLREEIPKYGLHYSFKNKLLSDWAIELVNISKEGLQRRNKVNGERANESIYLDPLFEISTKGTLARRLINFFKESGGKLTLSSLKSFSSPCLTIKS